MATTCSVCQETETRALRAADQALRIKARNEEQRQELLGLLMNSKIAEVGISGPIDRVRGLSLTVLTPGGQEYQVEFQSACTYDRCTEALETFVERKK